VVTDRGRPVLKIVPYRGGAPGARRALRGSVLKYDDPTAPVGVEDWEALGVIVLDTHGVGVVWSRSRRSCRRGSRELSTRNETERAIYVSAISAWEVAQLVKKGRLQLTMSVEDWVAQCEALPVLRFVTARQSHRAARGVLCRDRCTTIRRSDDRFHRPPFRRSAGHQRREAETLQTRGTVW